MICLAKVSEEFTNFILDQLALWEEVDIRKMFGGIGLYSRGVMFGVIYEDTVFLKVDDLSREKYESHGSGPFIPFQGRPTIKSYYEVPSDILLNRQSFVEWADEALVVAIESK